MNFPLKNELYNIKKFNKGFAIPQVLILGVGVAVAVSGLISVSILGRTGSRIKRQELIAKASSFSGITSIRSLLNDSSQRGNFHYFWLVNSCSEETNECDNFKTKIPNPSQDYWSDDEWCKGSINCNGRQKAPICTHNEKIDWDQKLSVFTSLLDSRPDKVGLDLENSERDFDQAFKFISTKYIGTEKYGVNSMLIEGIATSNKSKEQTAANKSRVNVQVVSETTEEGFGFLSIGENQLDGKESLFLGNLSVTPTNDSKGSIIWRRNLNNKSECGNFKEEAKANNSSLPSNGNGGIWVQPLGLPKQPRLSNVNDIGILICTPKEIKRNPTNCRVSSEDEAEKIYRIHSLYVKGPGSKFEISTTDYSKIILEIMGDIDISNGGIFCHKNGSDSCGTGKPENLTILFKQKTTSEGNKIVCNDIAGGVKLKDNIYFANNRYPIDNNQLPGSSFLIDNTGNNSSDEFGAFIYGPKTTFLSVLPKSEWVQISNSEEINGIAGMVVTTRSSYGWIKNALGGSLEDKMVNIVLTPSGALIPYLGHKVSSISNEDEYTNIEIIGVGNKINPLPLGAKINISADKVFLIYDQETKSYYLRTFKVENANPIGQESSEYSYPRAFARIDAKSLNSHVDLQDGLDSPTAKTWLETFNIKVQKSSPIITRNFSGAAWVKNLCLDNNGEKNWRFSKNFIDKLSARHGEEFNWGVRNYKGRSIILWDTLRDFKS
tara:strand:+ start:119 stop:2275 length:2157 start_codon:yes stop_codon:yes gene_type:complete